MSERAHIQAVETLRDMESSLGRFAGEAQEALNAVELEIRRTLEWLQERLHHWRREVERRYQEVQQARVALGHCRNSGYYDQDGHYHAPDCSGYEAALATAQHRLQEAEAELANTRNWLARVQEEVAAYRVEARRLQRLTTNQTKRAQAFLARKRGDVERYVALSQRALAAVLPIIVHAIPLTYDRLIGNVRSSVRYRARKQESELVQATGRGTRDWSQSELSDLKAGKFPKGYQGHHINSVSRFPELAGNPDNITFVKFKEHFFGFHRGNSKNATSGKMYNRKSLMVQWARHK